MNKLLALCLRHLGRDDDLSLTPDKLQLPVEAWEGPAAWTQLAAALAGPLQPAPASALGTN